MRLAQIAWDDVTPKTIANCWRKAGILPSAESPAADGADVESPAAEIEKVEAELDTLESIGVLHKKNRVELDDLFNPEEEQNPGYEKTTDQELFQSVTDAQAEDEGADDENPDDDEPELRPRPSRKDALQAVDLLQQYISPMDADYARKMETILASFGRQTRLEREQDMQPTIITDFFAPATANKV